MQKITVSRDDNIYEAFADIAQAADGTLVCTYRESMCHGPWPWSKLIVRRSHDLGLTWGPRQVIFERTREQSDAGGGRLNCARLAACADGTLLLVIDRLNRNTLEEYYKPELCMNLLWRSHDHGATWEGPEETGITEGIVPSIKQLANGDLLLGVTALYKGDGGPAGDGERQTTYVSGDGGHTWEGPHTVPDPSLPTTTGAHWRLNEGDYVELDDGELLLYMREDGDRLSAWKSLSTDGGRTWSEALRTQMPRCHGRPSTGRLRSGEIVITYRLGCGQSTSLALYAETPTEALRGFAGYPDEGPAEARFAVLDNDRSLSADSGYSGWVQLPEGDLYVVNYVNDDAPRAHIRGYQVGREDWHLFPEGAFPHHPPGDHEGGYYETAQALAREQQQRAAQRDGSRRVPTHK